MLSDRFEIVDHSVRRRPALRYYYAQLYVENRYSASKSGLYEPIWRPLVDF
jgi:hypothetical protein